MRNAAALAGVMMVLASAGTGVAWDWYTDQEASLQGQRFVVFEDFSRIS